MRLMKLQTHSISKNRRDHSVASFSPRMKPGLARVGLSWRLQDKCQTQFIGHRLGKRALERMSHVKSFKGIQSYRSHR
jgi:hypothetical protein